MNEPRKLGGYEVLARIAEGGMATVHAGRSIEDPSQLVAIKVIRPELTRDKGFVAMFLDEAQIAAKLHHPNVIELIEFGHDGKHYFLAMELLVGQTLASVMDAARKRGERLPFDVAAWICARVAEGLHHAHEAHDIIHRDVNPANVLITYEGRPKIIDFGLARAANRIASTAAGIVKGKLAYLAPEQAEGKPIDRRADIFSLGVTLWELTTDRRLFKADDDVETVRSVLAGNVPEPTTIVDGYPKELSAIVMRALARDPAKRWQTGEELANALDAFVGGSIDESSVATLLTVLFPPDRVRTQWEKAVEDVVRSAARSDGIMAWDDDAQKMTWMQLEGGAKTASPIDRAGTLAMLERAAKSGDAAVASRAEIESALLAELAGETKAAIQHARAALTKDPSAVAAQWILRRVRHTRADARALIEHLDAELAASSDAGRADLHAERARILAAANEAKKLVVSEWERALAVRADLPAALTGLETALAELPDESAKLADHLGKMAELHAAEPKLAAWLRVERAHLLDGPLKDEAGAKETLRRALELDPGLGPVRNACVRHASVHRDWAGLATLLDAEAQIETNMARAARLELDAACICRRKLSDLARAAALLTRAAARSPTTPLVDRRVWDELVEIHENLQRWQEARTARRYRTKLLSERQNVRELSIMAALAERAGEPEKAIADLLQAHVLEPTDERVLESLDRLLAPTPEKHEAFWADEGSRAPDPASRARAHARASDIAVAANRIPEAIAHLRAAAASAPDDPDFAGRLAGMLAGTPAEATIAEVKARAAVYARAADASIDGARKTAWLERIALLQEEAGLDRELTTRAWEDVLRADPQRRSALLGLQRSGDPNIRVKALLEEAKLVGPEEALRLQLRAIATMDDDRSLRLIDEVLKKHPAESAAHVHLVRLHERAGRWKEADRALAARIDQTKDPRKKVSLWLARADIQRLHLGDKKAALASLRAARKMDTQAHADEIAALAAESDDADTFVEALQALGAETVETEERARLFSRAAEMSELVQGNDAAAASTYEKALEAMQGDAWLTSRLAGVSARVGKKKPKGVPSLDEALVLLSAGDAEGALAMAIPIAEDGTIAALRVVERAAQKKGAIPIWANAVASRQAVMKLDAAILTALWTEATLVEWRLPESGSFDVYQRILARAPGDRAALDALLRRALAAKSHDVAVKALDGLLEHASDDGVRRVMHLALATLLEDAGENGDALVHYRLALRIDERSPAAALGTARTADVMNHVDAKVDAASARAALSDDPGSRAMLLVQAAGLLLQSKDSAKRDRAAGLLERALEADPGSTSAAGTLISLLQEKERDKLLSILRSALERTDRPDAIVVLGSEVARIARMDAAGLPFAVSALERVRKAAPGNVTALLSLADAYAAQGGWSEAAGVLESAVERAKDAPPKKRALLALAEIYERSLSRPADAVTALRTASDLDPNDAKVLRMLVERLRKQPDARAEVAERVARLASIETTPEAKGAAWLELSENRLAQNDRPGAEQALAMAIAETPAMLPRAKAFCTPPSGPTDLARLLGMVAARGAEISRPDAAILAALAELEIETLGKHADGVAHARTALGLNPALHSARATLARGLSRVGQHAEAASVALPMFDGQAILALPNADPLLETLETSLHASRRQQESIVVRELRALDGGVDDAVVVGLRARRLPDMGDIPLLDREALVDRIAPREAQTLLFEIALAISGAESKPFPTELETVGTSLRGNVPQGHPIRVLFQRTAASLGVEGAELVVSEAVLYPQAAHTSVPVVIAPPGIASAPEPVQTAAFVRALVRIVLGVPWIGRASSAQVRGALIAAARLVAPHFAEESDEELAAELAKPMAKAIGRKHKKALSLLEAQLQTAPAPTAAEVDAFIVRAGQIETRAAFVLTGDLLATLDDLRAADGEYARVTQNRGPAALAATFRHPLAGDLVRFALSEPCTTLRREAGTIWAAV